MADLSGRRWLSRLGLAGIVLSHCGFQGDFHCEEAAAHIAACCDGGPAIACTTAVGCGGAPGRSPDLSASQAQCVLHTGCDELRAAGACETATRWQCDGTPCDVLDKLGCP